MTDEGSSKPEKVAKHHHDWVTSFDRDLIRAAKNKIRISFESMDDEIEYEGVLVIQVDKDFIKVQLDGDAEEVWFNKTHLCKVVVPSV